MYLERFYDPSLAQASYLIGCQATGEALVVDPLREVDPYVEAAAAQGLSIVRVTETHIHADFVSGARELARRTGARLLLSGEGGRAWRHAFADRDGAVLLHDGDSFSVGKIRIDVLHTPGHTPEHLTFLVTDTAGADEPMGALTGDFLFVGDVGRPDLLEKAAKFEGTMEAGARDLFESLRRFSAHPDWLQIWPGHGAGSACGKGLGAVPGSTLGYERRFNPAFSHADPEAFVAWVLEGQPDPPTYFAEMKRINRDGPPILGPAHPPRELPDDILPEALSAGLVLDLRPASAFAGAHVPGVLNLPLNGSFTGQAGWILPYDRRLHLLAEDAGLAHEAQRRLRSIGLDRIEGFFRTTAISAWARRGEPLETIGRVTPEELEDLLSTDEVRVLDVRARSEWETGRIPGATHLPLGELQARRSEVPGDRPLVLQCAGGSRSAIAAGLLQALGIREVLNLEGGIRRWIEEGRPVEAAAIGSVTRAPTAPN